MNSPCETWKGLDLLESEIKTKMRLRRRLTGVHIFVHNIQRACTRWIFEWMHAEIPYFHLGDRSTYWFGEVYQATKSWLLRICLYEFPNLCTGIMNGWNYNKDFLDKSVLDGLGRRLRCRVRQASIMHPQCQANWGSIFETDCWSVWISNDKFTTSSIESRLISYSSLQFELRGDVVSSIKNKWR